MRIRTVKPEFFKHEELFDAEIETKLPLRISFAGLFCACDREGRFKWRPRKLKSDILPYDEINFEKILEALEKFGFIHKYYVDNNAYGVVINFSKHQKPNNKEKESEIPEPPEIIEPLFSLEKKKENLESLKLDRVEGEHGTWNMEGEHGTSIAEKFFSDFVFAKIKSEFKKATGVGSMGDAEKKLAKIITDQTKLDDFLDAIKNYGQVLQVQTWRKPKTTLSAFIGSKSHYFFKDYIDPEIVIEARRLEARSQSGASKQQAQEDIAIDQLKRIEMGLL